MVFNIGFYIIEAGASKRLRHNESSENYIVDSDYNTILKITFLRSYFSTINKSSRSQKFFKILFLKGLQACKFIETPTQVLQNF